MDRRGFVKSLAATVACPICASLVSSRAAQASSGTHWTYEGHEGPENWGSLDPAYAACSTGKEQSPIDLRGATPAMVGDLNIRWQSVPLNIVNNGHTIQVNTPQGGGMMMDGMDYSLLQFHFHHPSEHTVNGVARAMEVHFVHKAENGNLAVIGVFFQPGAENTTLAPIWAAMPSAPGNVSKPDMISPAAMLPKREVTWRYAGSLTTPPCTEIVSWIVFQDAIEASPAQIQTFGTLFPMNARPVLPLNRRKLLVDFY